jgi:hypothetical protein
MTAVRLVLCVGLSGVVGGPVAAQSLSPRQTGPVSVLDLSAGYAGFVDDATIDHAIAGVGGRVYVTRRLSIGPEVVYMRGPGSDRDLFLTGNLTYDMVGERGGRPPRVVPFWVLGGGYVWHQSRIGSQGFRYTEGALTGGGGARVWLTDRTYVAGDVRLGWELHSRVAGMLGIGFGR